MVNNHPDSHLASLATNSPDETDAKLAPQLDPTIALSMALMERVSVTPDDAGCQELLAERLQALGFTCEFLYYGDAEATGREARVKNLWATRGSGEPVLCFAGHTDVVPTGDPSRWTYPPFTPTIADGYLWGRGAADMKTAIAAFVVACERFIAQHPDHHGTIALLITADEEGPSVHGTVKVVETLQARGQRITHCLVGEPSSTDTLGDVIKNGRRGSLGATVTVTGKQGHVAYPHLAVNPIHVALPALAELVAVKWDTGNAYFPATSLQLSNINGGTGATNVIPETMQVMLNFRYSTETNAEKLKQTTEAIFARHFTNSDAQYHIDWQLSGLPFLTAEGDLVAACQEAILSVTGTETQLSTSGGTSDGRFIAPMGAQVVELGVRNATIHQVDERVELADLPKLTDIYQHILHRLLTD